MRGFVFYTAVAAAVMLSATASAENDRRSERSSGYVTGSFETNTFTYQDDKKTFATAPEGKFGSNNYLKVDYYNRHFSAGVQLEAYAPAAVGYPNTLTNAGLTNYYVAWTDDCFSVTAGTFYEQFGSGLLFRSWEDRALGINNSILGARVAYNFKDIVSVKALWGMPRFGMDYYRTQMIQTDDKNVFETERKTSQVRGADASFAVSNLLGWQSVYFALEGSVLNRYEAVTKVEEADGVKPNSTGYSARVNLDVDGFFLKGEYVDGGAKYFKHPLWEDYDYEGEKYPLKKGNAQLLETGYTGRGLGVSLSLRRLEWMESLVTRYPGKLNVPDVNTLNYVPGLCTQYTYMLTTLHPYGPQIGLMDAMFINSGELGGQFDVFYNFRRGTALGGKRGMKVHANFSTYYTIAEEGTFKSGNLLFRDLSVDIEKQWTKQFKSTLLWSMQEYNGSYGANKSTMLQNIFVADLLYKYTDSLSSRLELQYLTTHEDQKDWMAALLEVNFAPSWCVYAADMWNHGSTKIHYYNGGVSYTKSRTRVALSYGRYKAGKICSGGMCRTIPAYTGFNLTLTTSF